MYILTHHYSLIGLSASDGTLTQITSLPPKEGQTVINFEPAEVALLEAAGSGSGSRGTIISSGPLAGYQFVKGDANGSFSLFMEGFICVPPNGGKVTRDRQQVMTWETFHFVDPEDAPSHLRVTHQREEALGARVNLLLGQKLPICLHFGCAATRLKGFLNVDKYISFGDPEDYYLLDFTEKPWPIPDSSVDYIYSEDFIEHIQQQNQIAFLAEAFRVLKKGWYNRVSTP